MDDSLETLLASAHRQLGVTVYDSLTAQGGPPELRDPELALGRLLASMHRHLGTAVRKKVAYCLDAPPGSEGRQHDTNLVETLMQRPASARLKHRSEALDLAQLYRPDGLVKTIDDAVTVVQELSSKLEEERPCRGHQRPVRQAWRSIVSALRQLPHTPTLPPAVVSYDYLEEVGHHLSERAFRLVNKIKDPLVLIDKELLDYLEQKETAYLGAWEVAQDITDDLLAALGEATSLAMAVRAVEESSNDFRGADVRMIDLSGMALEGIRWDMRTLWPDGWQECILHASETIDVARGVLLVSAEPTKTVAADL